MNIENTKNLFDQHSGINAFHVTTDGQAFERADHAATHGKSLGKENSEVAVVSRADVYPPKIVDIDYEVEAEVATNGKKKR